MAEHQLSLAADKEESIVRKGGCGRKTERSGVVEQVKWLGLFLMIAWNLGITGDTE